MQSKPSMSWPPLEIQPDVKIYMYCTCAPCGDASMELCMAAQDDSTPWAVPSDRTHTPDQRLSSYHLLDGRAHFSLLGIVRRKPARADAEPTLSKSCSDKLALRQVSSLLSFGASLLVAPTKSAYLSGLILPEEEISLLACDRSFGARGRMRTLSGRSWGSASDKTEHQVENWEFRFWPFEVLSIPTAEVDKLWRFGKPKQPEACGQNSPQEEPGAGTHAPAKNSKKLTVEKSKPGNVSAVWGRAPSIIYNLNNNNNNNSSLQPGSAPLLQHGSTNKSLPSLCGSRTGLYETIVNGVKQGNRAASPTPRGASLLSRAKVWELLREIIVELSGPDDRSDFPSVLSEGGEDAQGPTRPTGPSECLLVEQIIGHEIRKRICSAATYEDLKRSFPISAESIRMREKAIQDAKDVLRGWLANRGDEDWGLEVLLDRKKRRWQEVSKGE